MSAAGGNSFDWGTGGPVSKTGSPFRGFSEDDDKIVVGARRDRKRRIEEPHVLERQGMFTEKLASVVGPSYVLGKSYFFHVL